MQEHQLPKPARPLAYSASAAIPEAVIVALAQPVAIRAIVIFLNWSGAPGEAVRDIRTLIRSRGVEPDKGQVASRPKSTAVPPGPSELEIQSVCRASMCRRSTD